MSISELIAFGILIVLVGGLLAERWVRHRREERVRADAVVERVIIALQQLKRLECLDNVPDLIVVLGKKSQEQHDNIERLVSGLESMCKELCRAVDSISKGLEIQERFLNNNDHPEEEDTGEGVESAREIRSLIAKGIDPDMAEKRVLEKNLYRRMERNR